MCKDRSMQDGDAAAVAEKKASPEKNVAVQQCAARLNALLRHLFLYDRGNLLRVIEESGLSMTQCKALLELAGLGEASEPRHVNDLAETLGVSAPSMSRAVDALVRDGLATRIEDPDDRRARRVAITPKGKRIVDAVVVVRQAGMEAFAASLSAAQRRKLDAAVDSLMDRDDIAEAYRHLTEVGPE
jgi:DNA-binding MarR family transcriptional regulator